jgi:hypothetical protein
MPFRSLIVLQTKVDWTVLKENPSFQPTVDRLLEAASAAERGQTTNAGGKRAYFSVFCHPHIVILRQDDSLPK